MVMFMDLVDKWRRPCPTEVVIRRDVVEVRCKDTIVGTVLRDDLRRWLHAPFGTFAYDDMAWLGLESNGSVALAINNIVEPSWLSDTDLQFLLEMV